MSDTHHIKIQSKERAMDWALAMFMVPIIEYETLAAIQHTKGLVPTFMFIPGTKEGPRRGNSKIME